MDKIDVALQVHLTLRCGCSIAIIFQIPGWCRVEICHLALAELQRYSMCAAFFKMAALITSLHGVVQEFIETPCRANINLNKDTCTRIGPEVLQLSRAVVKRHTLGGNSQFRYHLAQPYRMPGREFLHWNKLVLRRMKYSSRLRSPWQVSFSRNMVQAVFYCLQGLVLAWDLGEKTKETKHVVEIKIHALGHFKHLILTVANKYNANSLNDNSVLFKAVKDGSYCKAVVNDSHPVSPQCAKTLEIVRIEFCYGSWNRSGIPQHTIL